MTMREKIALSFEKRIRGHGFATYLALADDAFAELEEPTEGMLEAGMEKVPAASFVDDHAFNVWRAMIAAAKEG